MIVAISIGVILAAMWLVSLIREGIDNYNNYDDWNNHV